MLPSRCPHCQAELPKLGRFCVMCGRRVEGWRGLMPAGDPDIGLEPEPGPNDPDDPATPREIRGSEERTRPVRASLNLAAAAATAHDDDEESRKPTGEVPSIGHELRAKAPNQRVHTSPIGNILPSEVLETLDEAVAANSARPVPTSDATRRGGVGRSGAASGADRTPSTPLRQSGKRDRGADREDRSQEDRSEDRSARTTPKPRRLAREFPAVAPPVDEPLTDETPAVAHRSVPRRAANAPLPVGAEPTHFIPRRRDSDRALGVLRTLMWALLWLGLGGVVAFSVVVLVRRYHQPKTLPPSTPVRTPQVTPPRRPTAVTKVPNTASRPLGVTVPAVSATQARDLVVPIPAGGRPPLQPAPAVVVPSGLAAPGVTPPVVAPVAAPLDPLQRAAAEQTMSNIEFVISERVAQVRACYDRAVRSAGPDAPAGRVEVSLTLTDTGAVQSVVTVGNTVGSPLLSGCLEQRIAEWHFPRPLGTARTFRLPFTFSPSPEQSGPRPRR